MYLIIKFIFSLDYGTYYRFHYCTKGIMLRGIGTHYSKPQTYNSSGTDSDNISIKILKLCMPQIVSYITHIVNYSLENVFFSGVMKNCTKVIPIPKHSNPILIW